MTHICLQKEPSAHALRRLLWLGAFLWLLTPPAGLAQSPDERTLSPYFLVEGAASGADPLPLAATEVTFDVTGIVADVTVRQVYKNEGKQPLSARYVFPASVHAAVTGLSMQVGNRVTEAVIEERKQAERTYEAAKRAGKTASLLAQERPNVFSMQVANVMPGDRIEVTLHYVETLVPTEGVYEFVYPTVVGPRYASDGQAEPAAMTATEAPYLPESEAPSSLFALRGHIDSGIPLADLSVPSHTAKITRDSPHEASVALESGHEGDRDFILRYVLQGREVQAGLLLYEGPEENYFLLTVEPPQRPTAAALPPREYVFVIDVSGSMFGFPLDVAKGVIRDLSKTLRPQDTFNILLFSGGSRQLWPRSKPATRAHLQEAMRVIDSQQGGGSTELLPALQRALAMETAEHASRSFIVVTDGYITAEREAFTFVREHLGEANLFAFGIGSSINRFLVDGLAKAGLGEAFVITDPAESATVAARFHDYVATPVLTDIEVRAEGFDAYDLEPKAFPDLLARRPLVVHGKWRGKKQGRISVTGHNGLGTYRSDIEVSDGMSSPSHAALSSLWARARISALSDFGFGPQADVEEALVTQLGLRHHLLTKFTSFVAVMHEVRNTTGGSQTVNQPLPLPLGVSENALSEPMYGAPEPPLWLLLATALLSLLLLRAIGMGKKVGR